VTAAKPRTPARPTEAGESPATKQRHDEVSAWVADLWNRANAGDAAVASQVATLFDLAPCLVTAFPGLQKMAEERLLDVVASRASGRLATREHLRRQVAAVREAMAGPAPTPLETLLADRVAVDWLNAAIADLQHAEALAAGHAAEADRLLRRSDRSQRQLLRGIKTLATIRRLQVPAVQVNIADQQLNLAT
jgi:hypothetical protein